MSQGNDLGRAAQNLIFFLFANRLQPVVVAG